MNKGFLNWFIFILLSIIWGSSFIMMKEGLLHLSAFQVASLRIIFSGIVLFPAAIRHFKSIPKDKVLIIFLSGVLGSLLPAYLFCVAEMGIDGALAGTLNSLTPIFVIITGALFFSSKTSTNKILGICIAFTGSILLLLSKGNMQESQNLVYVSYVVLATIFYGFNVNMVHKHLHHIGPIQIASVALTLNAIPALIVLYFTGYFNLPLSDPGILYSTGHAALLGILGTAIASIIFYVLIKRAGAVFSSMVTYGIPIVANFWGIIYGEEVGLKQFGCLALILLGVYLANRKGSD
ncbi:MAG: DMT family transporter [Chitinophagaceae bacterium]|nr:DMT family transporter [Chitinophagaceae bacterium]MBK9485236.1 DMT family transporter [Chitinophagaceae bacterium]MBL0199804.1 DMT family transporter [Chitinophagaceae bacterium]